MHKHAYILLLVAGLAFSTFGCSRPAGGPTRFAVNGTVTIDGKPVDHGTLTFEPNIKQGNDGPPTGCPVKDGKFTVAAGHGSVGGAYVVRLDPPTRLSGTPVSQLFEASVLEMELPKESSEVQLDFKTKVTTKRK
ncbi:hypothetical protein SH661x_003355 [Planctomicrobium sp. SH661]|uniref:hypothetical protein n=1 Tax=Planctomicrobium sp. SH661 TaxID=3448124 RepID=UPI003F5B9592